MKKLLKNIGSIKNKTVLLRVDFNVTLKPDHSIADDYRIKQALPTIKHLLKKHNKIVVVTHLGKPKGIDPKFTLKPVIKDLQNYLPKYNIVLIDSIDKVKNWIWKDKDILVLENIRFFKGEIENDQEFSKQLASLAEVYVNDAFGVSHRKHASIVGITRHLPSFAGLLLQTEIEMIGQAITKPKHPVIAIIGGAKVSTKIELLEKLMEIADTLLVGGGIANTFFASEKLNIGTSFHEKDERAHADTLLKLAQKKKTELVLPVDVVIGDVKDKDGNDTAIKAKDIDKSEKRAILDIGPETQAEWGNRIASAKTIIWNGPVGFIEHPSFRRGTDFIYYSIAENKDVISVIGGGETLAALSNKAYLDTITHISTGGGAMLTYIEKGTLVGIEALKSKN